MRTFASEFVQEPLMGARPNDLEVIPLTFDVIVTRSVSLVMQMCLFCFSSCTESPSPPHWQGVIQAADRTKPLTGARYGTLVHVQIVKYRLSYQRNIIWARFLFLAKNRPFPLFLLFTPRNISYQGQ